MADVFLSYKRSPTRQLLVRRLALILRANELSVWWDTGLESGQEFEAAIKRQLEIASIVTPLWCAKSVNSPWVLREAELGRKKLLPVRMQNVDPPGSFESLHACDLAGWDGDARNAHLLLLIESMQALVGKPGHASKNMADELEHLPRCKPLPAFDPKAAKMLDRLRRSYLAQDPLIDFDEAAALHMHTPIDHLITGTTAEEKFSDLWRWLSDVSDTDLLEQDDEPLFDSDELEDVGTVGDLVWVLVEHQRR